MHNWWKEINNKDLLKDILSCNSKSKSKVTWLKCHYCTFDKKFDIFDENKIEMQLRSNNIGKCDYIVTLNPDIYELYTFL